ncbi:MAG: hypothetical protein MUQ65_03380 [Armatimonadetes bacterium]|nr:hypothetical protein [Armatimonadota bacterium]
MKCACWSLGARKRLQAKSPEPFPLLPLIEPLVVIATMLEYHVGDSMAMTVCE